MSTTAATEEETTLTATATTTTEKRRQIRRLPVVVVSIILLVCFVGIRVQYKYVTNATATTTTATSTTTSTAITTSRKNSTTFSATTTTGAYSSSSSDTTTASPSSLEESSPTSNKEHSQETSSSLSSPPPQVQLLPSSLTTTTTFDYDEFWRLQWEHAIANNKTLTTIEKQEEAARMSTAPTRKRCPKVYIYENLSNEFIDRIKLENAQRSVDSVYGPKLMEYNPYIRDTHQYSFAQILWYRIKHSSSNEGSRCYTTDPTDADLFWIPIHPYIMGSHQWEVTCNTLNATKLLSELTYLTAQNSYKHFFVISKGHTIVNSCNGWWSEPFVSSLFRNFIRISYSHVEFHKYDIILYNKTTLNETYWINSTHVPNLYSVAYPSNVHWTSASSSKKSTNSDQIRPPWELAITKKWTYDSSSKASTTDTDENDNDENNVYLMSYVGSTNHGMDIPLRQRIKELCIHYSTTIHKNACRTNTKYVASRYQSIRLKKRSIFCLEPVGDTPWRKSISDSVTFGGCIPIYFHNATIQFGTWNWNTWKYQASLYIPRYLLMNTSTSTTTTENSNTNVNKDFDLYTLLSTIPNQLLELYQTTIYKYGRQLQYSIDDDYPNDGISKILDGLYNVSRTNLNKQKQSFA